MKKEVIRCYSEKDANILFKFLNEHMEKSSYAIGNIMVDGRTVTIEVGGYY